MVVRKTARREVRLDPEHDRRLADELRQRGLTFAEWVREQIDRDVEEKARAERLAALEELFKLEVDWGFEDELSPGDPASNLIRRVMAEDREATPNLE